MNIVQGWNLLGTFGNDINIKDIFTNDNDSDIIVMYGWNGSTYFGVDITTGTLETGRSYWVKYANEVIGAQVNSFSRKTSVTINVINGWNLVSTPFDQDISVSDFSNVIVIYGWNGSTYYGVDASTGTLEAGHGYWMKFSAADTFTFQTTSQRLEATTVNYQNSASLIAVLNDSEHYVKEGDVIAAYDANGDIRSYETLRVAKNTPLLPDEPHLATVTINNVASRQYAYEQGDKSALTIPLFALTIALDSMGVSGGIVTFSIPSGQSISGSTEVISNIRQLTYKSPISFTGGYVFNESFVYRVTNGSTTKEATLTLSIEPKYYFGGNIGLEENIQGVTYKYWDSDQRKVHDLVYSFGDNPANVGVDSILGTPFVPVEFSITQSARKKFQSHVSRSSKKNIFPVRKKNG